MSNLANVDMPRIVGGDLLRVPDIAHAIRQDRRRLNQQPGCLGASLERTEEGRSWARTVKSELFEKPNAGRRRQPDAGRRMAETTWAVHLILTVSSDPAGSASQVNRRGPDHHPKTRRTLVDTGVGPEHAPDWTSFDVGGAVLFFKICPSGQARLSIRKTASEMVAWSVCHYGPYIEKGWRPKTGVRIYTITSQYLHPLPYAEQAATGQCGQG